MRILILTSCTGQKTVQHERALTCEDFARGPAWVETRERELADLLRPARDLYSGQQHVRLLRGLDALAGRIETRLCIVSAGYGLVRAEQPLAPYECTFSGRPRADLRAWAERLGIPGAFRTLMAEPYDLCLLLLGDDYLSACGLDSRLTLASPTIALCGAAAARALPRISGLKTLVLGNAEAKRFSCGLVALKGEIAARLLTRLAETPDLLRALTAAGADPLALLRGQPSTRPEPQLLRIIEAVPASDRIIRLRFSDGTFGDYDLARLIARGTEMVAPLADSAFFSSFAIELGALCWPNGFALSARGIQQRLQECNCLHTVFDAASASRWHN